MKLIKIDSENETKHVELSDSELDVMLTALRNHVPTSDGLFLLVANLRVQTHYALMQEFELNE